jgi:hypothetical protein
VKDMRDLYKNPMFYYILAPILIGLWPLLVWAVYLPGGREEREAEETHLVEAQAAILKILELDPDRLEIAGPGAELGKFTYAEAIDRAANVCNIPSSNYNFTSGAIVKSGGKETQQARLSLDKVVIVQVAKFLSTLQSTWVNLTCEKATLKKKEGMRDQWDVDLDYRYSY